MIEDQIYQKYHIIANYYKLSNSDQKKLWKMIFPICNHEEFIKRCKPPYFHHGTITLSDHILADTILTYKLANRIKKENLRYNFSIKIAVYIAMFHDLYELPWQNSKIKKKFYNKHGFTHPIEATINAITWFPEYFESKADALKIIDGIIHHMYPLGVRAIDNYNMSLNNQEKYEQLPQKYKDMIIESTSIRKYGHYSFRKTFFLEGRILSKADKIAALRKELIGVNSYLALVSGKNKTLEKITKKVNLF